MNPPILPSRSSHQENQDEEHQDQDLFDLLPDPLLLIIFNKLSDAKSLALSLSVSKRFSSLIPLTDTVSLSLSLPPQKPTSKSNKSSFPIHLFKFLVHRIITKPFKCFHHLIITPKSKTEHNNNNPPHYSINQVLHPFQELKSVKIEIPATGIEIGLDGDTGCGGSLLKWKAEFGSKLKCCVIFGATSFEKNANSNNNTLPRKRKVRESNNTHLLTEEEMKLRIVWTMSCLIAASARHYLAKRVLAEQNRVESLVISDGKKQGKMQMGKEGIIELRNSMEQSLEMTIDYSPEMERTQVPDLSMKIWHAPVLELAETEYVMKGATLIVIRPVVGGGVIGKGCDDAEFFGCDEEKAINEAIKEMMKLKNSYAMTMNGF